MSQDLTKLLEQFNATQSTLQATLERQQGEIQSNGASSAETAKQVKEQGATLAQIAEDLKGVQTRIKDAEDEIARRGLPGAGDLPQAKTPGQMFTESDEYRDTVKNNRTKSDIVVVGSFHRPRNTLITSDPSTGAGSIVVPQRVPSIVAAPDRGLRIRDLIDVQETSSNAIEYVEETGFTNNAATRAENTAKPEAAIAFALRTASAQVIAHWIPATRQIIADAQQLRSYIDGRLTYGLKLVEETQILYGNGTSPNIQGIATHDDVQTYAWSSGSLGDTKIDAVRRAMTLARIAEYPVDGVVLNPTDWEDIELMKGDDEHYIWVNVNDGGVLRLWRVPVVESNSVTGGEAVLGAWKLGATLWDREAASVRISDSHSDYFIKNLVAILAEERIALTIYRPEAFVVVDFDGAPVS
jgi:HK97 family phage major capsid protein